MFSFCFRLNVVKNLNHCINYTLFSAFCQTNFHSVGGVRLILTCSRSGDRELQGPPRTTPLCRAGSPDPARTATKKSCAILDILKILLRLQVRKDLNVYRCQPSHGEKVRKELNVYRRSLSVGGDRPILTCSRSGDRELQGPWPLFCSAGSPDPAHTRHR